MLDTFTTVPLVLMMCGRARRVTMITLESTMKIETKHNGRFGGGVGQLSVKGEIFALISSSMKCVKKNPPLMDGVEVV